jgi:hypothetical protein
MSRYVPVLLIAVILGALVVSAQISTGTISGVVQDPTGAVVAGAMVTVRNVDTGDTRTLTSDAGGRYFAPVLPVGNYEVTAQQSGFQTEVRSGINLTVGREEVINLSLKVGQLSDKVTITAEAPLVESTTSAMSSLVDERTIRDLPLNGRSYDQLALFQPGVVTMGAGQASAAFDFGEGTRFSVTGSRGYANSFVLDGTDVNDHANGTPGGAAGTNLGVDGILEFKINTLVSPAEYGRSSGGVISAVTRSGTNSLHGSAFGFLRNSAFDSLGYFDEKNHGGTDAVAPYRRGQFGGSLGGPIKKDKTFYFGTYEGLRLGSGTNQSAEVPTANTLNGILPASILKGTPSAVYCVPNASTCTVPVSPAVKPYLDLFQAPNQPGNLDLGDGTGIWVASPLQVTDENYFMTRVDHEINEKTRIFVRYSFDKDSNVLPNVNGSAVANELDQARRQYSTIQANSILRPTLINSLRVGYNRTYQNFDDVLADPRAQKLSFIPGRTLGTISFGTQGLSTGPLNFLGVDNGAPRIYTYNLFQGGDDLTYIRGKHAIKMGVDVKRIQDNELASGNGRGDYTFLDIPGFLANTPIRFDAPPPSAADAYRGLRETLFGVYVQDDIKMTQRFTLNLGLRYEALTNPSEVNGKMSALLNISDPAPKVLTDSYFSIAKKDFQPRAGFAWQLNGSGTTVVRAGFGLFHDHILPYAFATGVSGMPPFFRTLSDLAVPQANYYPAFPFDPNLASGPPPPGQFNAYPASIKEPGKIQYNLTLQQQVLKNTVLEVAYIGSESHHLQRTGEFNRPIPTYVNGQPTFPTSKPTLQPGCTVATWNANCAYGSITATRWDVNADYNALQVTLKHKTASGLQYQAFYTFSKSIDDKSTIAGGESRQEPNTGLDFTNPARDRGLSAFDARHNFVLTATYPFPFKFQQKVVGAILGGWTANGITTFRTGEPFTARVNSNTSLDGDRWNPDRPNLNPGFSPNPTSGVSAGCGKIAKGTPLGTPNLWYDPCAFSRPAPGTYGNLGRNTLTGPGYDEIDASIAKTFKPSERVNVQFRGEFFNLLNHANFYEPGFNVFTGGGAYSGGAGHITKLISSPGGRLVQLGLKVLF